MHAADCTPLTGRASLTGLGVIRARGADAASFLHGQLTQDIQSLTPAQARLAAFLSPKGRMLASFLVWRPQPDEVLLACSADLLAPAMKRLSMFVLRARCRLDDASAEWALQGLWAPTAGGSPDGVAGLPTRPGERLEMGSGACAMRLPGTPATALWLLAQPGGAESPAALDGLQGLPDLGVDAFHLQCIRAGLPWIVAATVEQFVPQMINFERIGGVHFQKGCYPGQEVVARSQYRGSIKRRAQRFQVAAQPRPGQEIFHSEDPGQPAGLVVLAAAAGPAGPWELLAEVKLACLEGGRLHLGAPDGPVLTQAALPYTVVDAEEAMASPPEPGQPA